MKSRLILWSIERRLVQRVNQHALKLTRRLFRQTYPDSEYSSLLSEIIETVIVDMIHQTAKFGDHAEIDNDDLLTALREIGMSVIDIRGFHTVRNMIELMTGRYNFSDNDIENRYFKLLDDMFEHFTEPKFYFMIMDSTTKQMSPMIMDGIRDDICLISFNITEPFIRMRFIYG